MPALTAVYRRERLGDPNAPPGGGTGMITDIAFGAGLTVNIGGPVPEVVANRSDATPQAVAAAGAAGSSNNMSRADHVHAHGDLAGGALHAVATTSVSGFMSAADKTKLDGIPEGGGSGVTLMRIALSAYMSTTAEDPGLAVWAGKIDTAFFVAMGLTKFRIRAQMRVDAAGGEAYISLFNLTNSTAVWDDLTVEDDAAGEEIVSDDLADGGYLNFDEVNADVYELRIAAEDGYSAHLFSAYLEAYE